MSKKVFWESELVQGSDEWKQWRSVIGGSTCPILSRIFNNTSLDTNSECWLWRGYKNKKGYGVISAGKKGRTSLVHRFVYKSLVGEDIAGKLVCHKCDNPSCVRPEHLWLGTIQENNLDRDSKGRQAKGDRSGRRRHPDKYKNKFPSGDAHWTRNRLSRVSLLEDLSND